MYKNITGDLLQIVKGNTWQDQVIGVFHRWLVKTMDGGRLFVGFHGGLCRFGMSFAGSQLMFGGRGRWRQGALTFLGEERLPFGWLFLSRWDFHSVTSELLYKVSHFSRPPFHQAAADRWGPSVQAHLSTDQSTSLNSYQKNKILVVLCSGGFHLTVA